MRSVGTRGSSAGVGNSSGCCLICCCSGGVATSRSSGSLNVLPLSHVANGNSCLIQSEGCDEAAPQRFQRRPRTHVDTPERRADRAQSLIMMGEVSSARHALEGALLAPGTERTWEQLRDPVRRPTTPHAPLPEALQNHQGSIREEFEMCSARRGRGTFRHDDVGLLFQIAQWFAASIPKPNRGGLGIVASDVFRRLVAMTMIWGRRSNAPPVRFNLCCRREQAQSAWLTPSKH